MAAPTETYGGCNFFRQRLILSTLSGKIVKIKRIRHNEDNPGLKNFEVNFIRLIDTLTNGSKIEVNETGTAVFYQPGLLLGGNIEHECSLQRSIGYYLEAILCLAPFCKKPIKAVLRGITNDQVDPSVDSIKYSSLPLLKRFLGSDDGLEIKICSRGVRPGGGGEIIFQCPTKIKLRPLQLTDPGKIKRIRGIAWAVRVSPAVANRIVDSCRGVLNQFLPDIYIHTDHLKGNQSGKSPGFGLTLVAETIGGSFLTAESASNPTGCSLTIPEELGQNTAKLLLEEIYRGGITCSSNQSLALLMMALGDKDVSKIQLGPLSPHSIQFLRDLRSFFQVMFKIDVEKSEDDDEYRKGGQKLTLTCVGVGYRNLNKIIA